MSRVAGIIPVIPCGDPWAEPDVLALDAAGMPWLEQVRSRLERAGATALICLAGPGLLPEGLPGVLACPATATFGELLHAGLGVVPPGAEVIVVHDPASALAPPELIARLAGEVTGTGRPAVLTREAAETVKYLAGGSIGQTVPRDEVEVVHSPLACPLEWLRSLEERGQLRPLGSFLELYAAVRASGPVSRVRGSALSAAIGDAGTLMLLECADEVLSGT